MQLNLLNVDHFISTNGWQEVTSLNPPSKTKQYSEPTLWSDTIFGRIGSSERRSKFGYIDLHTNVVNPAVYRILKGLNSAISAIMDGRKSYKLDNGKLIEDKENGSTGIAFLINHLSELDLEELAKKEKKKEAKFLTTNKELILINKLVVIPAESRDLDINSANTSVSEINTFYMDVLRHSQSVMETADIGDDELSGAIVKQLQWSCQKVYSWLSGRLTGKRGIFRSNLLKKSTDYSSRLILASSPAIKFGHIGVPWHTLIMLYDPLFFYNVKNKHPEFEQDILDFMKIKQFNRVNSGTMTNFIKMVNKSPNSVPPVMVSKIKEVLSEFIDEQTIVYKRDPALSRKSWASATPVIVDGAIATLNSLDLGPLGGDCITGIVSVLVEKQDKNPFLLDIESFPDIFDCILTNIKTRKDGVEIYEYIVKDEVYTRGINMETGDISISRIHKWWIHKNLNMFTVSDPFGRFNSFECSDELSLVAFDPVDGSIKVSNPGEIKSKKNLKLMQISKHPNNKDIVLIPYSELEVAKSDTTTAYDFTVDPGQRSFITSSGMVVKNSDGDQILIAPLFTDEAKKAAEKLNPAKSESKWRDVNSNSEIVYALSLDTISSIFHATKE